MGGTLMAKITITFDTDEDHRTEIYRTVNSLDLALAVWDINELLCKAVNNDDFTREEMIKDLQSIFEDRVGDVNKYIY